MNIYYTVDWKNCVKFKEWKIVSISLYNRLHSRSIWPYSLTLFTNKLASSFTPLLVYVDDRVSSHRKQFSGEFEATKGKFQDDFEIKDFGFLKFFLGTETVHSEQDITLCQRQYFLYLLTKTNNLVFKPSSFPNRSYSRITQWWYWRIYWAFVGKLFDIHKARYNIPCATSQSISRFTNLSTLP